MEMRLCWMKIVMTLKSKSSISRVAMKMKIDSRISIKVQFRDVLG